MGDSFGLHLAFQFFPQGALSDDQERGVNLWHGRQEIAPSLVVDQPSNPQQTLLAVAASKLFDFRRAWLVKRGVIDPVGYDTNALTAGTQPIGRANQVWRRSDNS